MRRSASEDGFSLVAVLVAIVLMSLALVALSGTMVSVVAFRHEADVRSVAAGLAASYMEEIKTRDPRALASEAPVAVDEEGAVTAGGRFTRATAVAPGGVARSKRITVTVSYPRGDANDGIVDLVTIIYEGSGP